MSSLLARKAVVFVFLALSVALAATVAAQGDKKGTRTSLSASPGASKVGQAVILTATVSAGTSSDKPEGALQFFDGEQSLGIVPLVTDGDLSTASLELATLAPGVHRLSARYAGHPRFFPSASIAISHVVSE
jgi:hypothetical protein